MVTKSLLPPAPDHCRALVTQFLVWKQNATRARLVGLSPNHKSERKNKAKGSVSGRVPSCNCNANRNHNALCAPAIEAAGDIERYGGLGKAMVEWKGREHRQTVAVTAFCFNWHPLGPPCQLQLQLQWQLGQRGVAFGSSRYIKRAKVHRQARFPFTVVRCMVSCKLLVACCKLQLLCNRMICVARL